MVLFSIPIYNWSEEDYQKKCDDFRQKYKKYNRSEIEISNHLNELYPNYYVWRNTIIGYIDVVYQRGELNYIVYETYSEHTPYKMRFNTRKKHYMGERQVNGYHTQVSNLTNEEIANEIKNDIDYIINYELDKRYIDLEQFLRVYKFIDYKKVFANYKENNNG